MKRYFVEIQYDGTNYSGWQIQPNAKTVQETIAHWFGTILKKPIEIVGCGRTDTGVHASFYIFHFDVEDIQNVDKFLFVINKALPSDISILKLYEVAKTSHARFDAHLRSYDYYLTTKKNAFQNKKSAFYPYNKLDIQVLNQAAQIILDYKEFETFCKANNASKTVICDVSYSQWELIGVENYKYTIHANRFLRGMVRLIVGMCINVASQKLTLDEVRKALNLQTRLNPSWSAPAEGLYLSQVKYPVEVFNTIGSPS